jgi:hypothetical protein
MKRGGPLLSVALCVAAILAISDAHAQFGGFGGGLGGARQGRGNRGGDSPGAARESRNERPVPAADPNSYEQIDYRLSLLQDDLKMSAGQYSAWQAFAGKVREYALDLARERNRNTSASAVGAPQTNGLQAIGQAVDAARNRLTALEDVEVAAKALYVTFTPDQKVIAEGRIAAIVMARPTGPPTAGPGANLPDPGAGARPPR